MNIELGLAWLDVAWLNSLFWYIHKTTCGPPKTCQFFRSCWNCGIERSRFCYWTCYHVSQPSQKIISRYQLLPNYRHLPIIFRVDLTIPATVQTFCYRNTKWRRWLDTQTKSSTLYCFQFHLLPSISLFSHYIFHRETHFQIALRSTQQRR